MDTREATPAAGRTGSPVVLDMLGLALAAACVLGGAFLLMGGQLPWPQEFFADPDRAQAAFRSLVSGVLCLALFVILRGPQPVAQRVRHDDRRE